MTVAEQEILRDKLKDRRLKVVAAKIGIHYNTLYLFTRGKSINKNTLALISGYFDG